MVSNTRDDTLFQKKLWPALKLLNSTIGSNDIKELTDGLRKLFSSISIDNGDSHQIHLLLLDESGTVTYVLISPRIAGGEIFDLVKKKIEIGQIGKKLNSSSIYRILSEQHISGYFLCERVLPNEVKERDLPNLDGSDLEYYDIRKLKLDAHDKTKVIGKVIWPNMEMFTGFDVDLTSDADYWMDNFVVTGVSWPGSVNIPPTKGVIAVSLPNDTDLSDYLLNISNDLNLITWLAGFGALNFQLQALSQASSDEPQRLRDEISYRGWIEILHGELSRVNDFSDTQNTKSITESLVRIQFINSKFVRRKTYSLLHEYSSARTEMQCFLVDFILQFVDLLIISESNRKDQDSYKLLAKVFSSPEMRNKDADWEQAYEELPSEVLRELIRLYPSLDEELKTDITDKLLPVLNDFLIQSKPKDYKYTKYKNVYFAVLSAIEEIIFASHDEISNISEILDSVVNNIERSDFREIQSSILKRSLFFMLNIFSVSDSSHEKNIIERLSKLFIIFDNNKPIPIQGIDKVLSSYSQDKLASLLGNLNSKTSYFEAISKIHDDQKYLSKLRNQSHGKLDPVQIISIVSTKGGVGKTSISIALASKISKLTKPDQKVCLVELDIFGPSLNYGITRLGLDGYYLNDFIWANYFQLVDKESPDLKERYNKIFKGKMYWRDRFQALSRSENLLKKVIHQTSIPTLSIIACSTNNALQDIMFPFLSDRESMKVFGRMIYRLINKLKSDGYSYIIFDCPAEVKELTLIATEFSNLYGGKNIFVANMNEATLSSIFNLVSTGQFIQGQNYLLINKVRPLDKKYTRDKSAFSDYWLSLENGTAFDDRSYLSRPFFEQLCNFQNIGYVSWSEFLHRAMIIPKVFSTDQFDRYSEIIEKHFPYLGIQVD